MSTLSGEMKLLCKRKIPALDSESLELRVAREALFRDGDRFVLYLRQDRFGDSRRRDDRLRE
jgi:hypothetical protein